MMYAVMTSYIVFDFPQLLPGELASQLIFTNGVVADVFGPQGGMLTSPAALHLNCS